MANPLSALLGAGARYIFSVGVDQAAGRSRQRIREQPLPSHQEILESLDLDLEALARPRGAPPPPPPPGMGEEIGSAVADAEQHPDPTAAGRLPQDLFSSVVGLEDEKRVLRVLLATSDQYNVLLVGGPGSGKTALMDEVGRVPNTRTVGGADLTGPGLRAMFLEPPPGAQTPDILVIDEIDQLKPVAVGTLRMLLIGKITAATHLQQREESTNVKVVAACNDERRVDPAIRDRFQVLRLVDLSEAERRRLLSQYLVRRKHLGAEEASEIADLVAPRSASVRDAARIATVWREDRELAVKLAANLRGASTV